MSAMSESCPICGTPVCKEQEICTRKQASVDENKFQEDEIVHEENKKNTTNESLAENVKKSVNYIWVMIGILLIVLSLSIWGYFYYKNIYLPKKIDREAPRFYTFSYLTNMRSSQMAGVDYNKIASLPYGSELITYSHGGEWSFVKNGDMKGFIYSNLLLNKEDFYLLNSIFGDDESRECVLTSRCRLALLNYFKKRDYIGKMPSELLNDIKPNFIKDEGNQWQVFCRNKAIKPNTIFYSRLFDKDSKFTDFAVLIRNIQTGDRKILIFTFSDDGNPSLSYERDAPQEGYIKNIRFAKDYFGERVIQIEYAD